MVEAPFLVFMVFSQESVQHRCLPENAFLSGLWSISLTLFQVEVFLVLMSLVKGFFRTFPQIKKSAKVTSHPGSELPPHSSSWTAAAQLEDSVEWVRLKDDNSGKPYTDALERLPGSHRLASRWCGTAKGMRRDWSGTGTGTRVSPRLTSLLFLVGEEQYRQPRAVF